MNTSYIAPLMTHYRADHKAGTNTYRLAHAVFYLKADRMTLSNVSLLLQYGTDIVDVVPIVTDKFNISFNAAYFAVSMVQDILIDYLIDKGYTFDEAVTKLAA